MTGREYSKHEPDERIKSWLQERKNASSEIGKISITVQDIERAVAFYRDILGLTFPFTAPNMAFFQCGSIRLMLAVPEKKEFDHRASIIYYRVDDIRATFSELRERGVACESEPRLLRKDEDHDLWMAFLRDSEGNLLALMSEVPH